MSLRRTSARFLPLLLLGLLAAAPVAAAPLSVEELLTLSREGVGETVLLSLARNQGVQGPLTASQVLEMSRAGFGDELLAAIVEAAARPAPAPEPTGVSYDERDGAVVAYSRGTPDESEPAETEPEPAEVQPAPPAPPFVIVQAPPAPGQASASAQDGNAYPVGAVHGWTGSTVFLPARFGGNPSAFGRTIVTNDPGVRSSGYYPYYPLGPNLPAYGTVQQPTRYGTTTIRTSRGPIRIPR